MHVKEIASDAFLTSNGQRVAYSLRDSHGKEVALFAREQDAVDYSSCEEFIPKRVPVPWIGVDLDQTLALQPTGAFDVTHIGLPVKIMADRVTHWLAQGICVKICTARVATDGTKRGNIHAGINRRYIEAWCLRHLKQELEVVSGKDYYMIELWDDRAISVQANTGHIVHRIDRLIKGVDVCGSNDISQ